MSAATEITPTHASPTPSQPRTLPIPTTSPRSFPRVRACLFDMDGLLLNTEDLYTICTNDLLARYGRPALPWHVKAQLQGRPGPAASAILQRWARLPLPPEELHDQMAAMQRELFPTATPLPGVEKLLVDLSGTGVHMALATSSHEVNFRLKTSHLGELFKVFPKERQVLGDDERIAKGRGKPAPDIYLLALETVNGSLAEGEAKVRPEECLVFEDSVPGVESGRRAGMRVVWCPHPELFREFEAQTEEVLAGKVDAEGEDKGRGEIGDGWAEHLVTLKNFPYERYGIVVK
jgi:pseudouridine-5'-monophosphatase